MSAANTKIQKLEAISRAVKEQIKRHNATIDADRLAQAEETAAAARAEAARKVEEQGGYEEDLVRSLGAPTPKEELVDRAIRRLNYREETGEELWVPGAGNKQVQSTLRKLLTDRDAGTITEEAFHGRLNDLLDQITIKAAEKKYALKGRARGPDFIRQRMLQARRQGVLSDRAVDMAEWFIKKNPALVEDLGISIKGEAPAGEPSTAGFYGKANRVFTLIAENAKDTTSIHEILHHLERMMPANIRAGLGKAWARSLTKARSKAVKAGDEKLAAFFDAALTGDARATKAALDGLTREQHEAHYQHFSPSEFWAVNGAKILENRFNSSPAFLKRLATWLREFGQHVKGTLGLKSDAPILRAIDTMLKEKAPELRTERLLTEEVGKQEARFVASYVGKQAKGADLGKLDAAEKRLEAGENAQKVRRDTGWFKGAEGKWRFEIPDDMVKWKVDWDTMPKTSEFAKPVRLEEVLDAPELFAAYPELKDIRFFKRNTIFDRGQDLGEFSPEKNELTITPNNKTAADALSSALHEIQHWIQTKEDFARGGNKNTVRLSDADALGKLKKYYERKKPAGYDQLNALSMKEQGVPFKDARDFMRISEMMSKVFHNKPYDALTEKQQEALDKDALHIRSKFEEHDKRYASVNELLANTAKNEKIYEAKGPQLEALKTKYAHTLNDMYTLLAGEREARDTQGRLKFTAEQRKEIPPYLTEGVREDEAIISMKDGVAASMLPGRKKRLSPEADELAKADITQVEKPETLLKRTGTMLKRVFDLTTDSTERHKTYSAIRRELTAASEGLSKELKMYDKYIPGFGLRADYLRNQYDGLRHIARVGIEEGYPVIEPKSKEVKIEPDAKLNLSKMMQDAANLPIGGTGSGGKARSPLEIVADVFRVKMAEQELQEYDRRVAEAQNWRRNAASNKAAAKVAATPREMAKLRKKAAESLDMARKIEKELRLQAQGKGREQLVLDPKLRLAANRILAQDAGVRDIADRWKALNKKLVKMWLDSGMIDADTAKDWTDRWYIPMQKSKADLAAGVESTQWIGGGGAKAVARIAPKKGGMQKVNVWENLYEHYLYMLAGAAKNNIRQQAFRQLEAIGAAKRSGKNAPGAIKMRVDGKDFYFTVDDADAFTALEMANEGHSALLNFMADAGNVYRNTLLMQPGYWGRSLIKEPLEANFTTSATTPIIKVITPLHSMYELGKIAFKVSKEEGELRRRGITGYSGSLANPARFSEALGKTGPKDKIIDFVHNLHAAFDDATRIVVYKSALRQAKEEGITDPDAAKAFAATEAREFINFQTKGRNTFVREYGRITPFLHAQLISMDRLIRAATGHNLNPKEAAKMKMKFRNMALMMAAGTVAYTIAQMHDKRYRDLPIRDWAMNWIGNWDETGHAKKIPAPYEVGFMFKFLPELMVRRALGLIDNEEAAKAFKDTFMDTMFPPGIVDPVPIVMRGLVELRTGVSLHSGIPIESIQEQRLRPEDRDKRATWLAQLASKEGGLSKMGFSPEKFDVFMRSVAGEIYQQSALAAELLWDKHTGKHALNEIPFDKDITERYPFVKNFLTNPRKDSAVPKFYEMAGAIDETINSINKAEGEYDLKRIDELEKDPEVKAHTRLAKGIQELKDGIRKLDKENAVLANVDMPEAEKRKAFDANIELRRKLARDGIEMISDELARSGLKKRIEPAEMFLSDDEIKERREQRKRTEHIETPGR